MSGATSLGVEPHRWDRAMSLQVKPLHGGGATAPVVHLCLALGNDRAARPHGVQEQLEGDLAPKTYVIPERLQGCIPL